MRDKELKQLKRMEAETVRLLERIRDRIKEGTPTDGYNDDTSRSRAAVKRASLDLHFECVKYRAGGYWNE